MEKKSTTPEAGKVKSAVGKIEPLTDTGGALGSVGEPKGRGLRSVKRADDLMDFNSDSELKPNKVGGKFIH